MENITDVQIAPCQQSNFLKPLRVSFCQNGKSKTWDALKVHDSVSVLIYNVTRQVLVLVRQFRPAVYLGKVEISRDEKNGTSHVDHKKFPGSLGVTYELCAGIVDKSKPLNVIAQEEVLEECGYQVPLENIQRIAGFLNGVGTSGSHGTMYYCEVTDEMRVGPGGGSAHEGELIDVVDLPVAEGEAFIMDESKIKPVHVMFALSWFYKNKYNGGTK